MELADPQSTRRQMWEIPVQSDRTAAKGTGSMLWVSSHDIRYYFPRGTRCLLDLVGTHVKYDSHLHGSNGKPATKTSTRDPRSLLEIDPPPNHQRRVELAWPPGSLPVPPLTWLSNNSVTNLQPKQIVHHYHCHRHFQTETLLLAQHGADA